MSTKVGIIGAGGMLQYHAAGFRAAGADIVAMSRSADELAAVATDVRALGRTAKTLTCDVTDTAAMRRAVDGLSELDILVNNAGITDDSLLLRMKTEQWDKIIQANLSSNFTIIKALLPNMIKNKSGKIIGISSVVATSGNPGQSNYVAAKSGMIGFYKSIALEVASRNINVNIVSPGFIISPMTDKLNDKQKNIILEKIPMKRFGESKEIADLVYFLSSDESKYVTGQNIHINGGMLMV